MNIFVYKSIICQLVIESFCFDFLLAKIISFSALSLTFKSLPPLISVVSVSVFIQLTHCSGSLIKTVKFLDKCKNSLRFINPQSRGALTAISAASQAPITPTDPNLPASSLQPPAHLRPAPKSQFKARVFISSPHVYITLCVSRVVRVVESLAPTQTPSPPPPSTPHPLNKHIPLWAHRKGYPSAPRAKFQRVFWESKSCAFMRSDGQNDKKKGKKKAKDY